MYQDFERESQKEKIIFLSLDSEFRDLLRDPRNEMTLSGKEQFEQKRISSALDSISRLQSILNKKKKILSRVSRELRNKQSSI